MMQGPTACLVVVKVDGGISRPQLSCQRTQTSPLALEELDIGKGRKKNGDPRRPTRRERHTAIKFTSTSRQVSGMHERKRRDMPFQLPVRRPGVVRLHPNEAEDPKSFSIENARLTRYSSG
mmetsp:Transcript_5129/g.32308  ORF Transcript_5129/g.32308 Transcript_5129/m.32308 type:complete len:121 (-) Transcript_5129:146-508(-)